MKKLGFGLVTLAFLVGTFFTLLDTTQVSWPYFIIAFLVGVAGVVTIRLSDRQKSRAQDAISSNMENVDISLTRVVENLTKLNREKADIYTYDVRHRIDATFPGDLQLFVDSRQSIAHAHGLQAYADIMSQFAAGERFLNRAWSASADGYIDEVNLALEKALVQFTDALKILKEIPVKERATAPERSRVAFVPSEQPQT